MDVSSVGGAAQATEALEKGPTQQTQPVPPPPPEPSESVSVEISDDAKALAASSLADK